MTTKLSTSNLSAETLAAISGPRISNVQIADSAYNTLDDTAANIGGGYIVINGQSFNSAAQVIIDQTPATSVTWVSNSLIRAQVPAATEGTSKSVYVINPDGSLALLVNGLTYSAFPAWSTNSTLPSNEALVPISIQLSAPTANNYTLAASNTLPSAVTLYANGLIAGTVAANTTTNYNFTVIAKDAENQDTSRSFTLPITKNIEPAWVTAADLGSLDVGASYSNTLVATDLSNVTYSVAVGSSLPANLTLAANGYLSGSVSAANTYSFGIVATDIANLSNTRTFTITISVAGDTYFKNTTLLLNGETTVTPFISDASTNSFGLTINGDTKPVPFSPYQGDGYYSNYFDGTGDYLYTSASSANAMGTGDYTVEAWIYVTAAFGTTGSGRGAIISNRGQASATNAFMLQHYNGKIYFGTSGTDVIVGSTTMVTNTWYHVVVSRSSGTVRLFLNGVSDATAVTGDSTNHSDTNAFYIGIDGAYVSYPFTGYISNARLVKGTAVYTSTFTSPTTPLTAIANTSLLTCQSNRFIDKSTNNFTITKNGDVSVSPAIPFTANSSYSTYGSGLFPTDTGADYLRLPASVSGLTFNADFTLEFWVYVTGAEIRQFFGSTTSGKCRLYVNGGYLQIYSNGSGTNLNAAGAWPNDSSLLNQWVHIAISRTGSNLYFFVNGVSKTITVSAGAVTDTLDFDNQSYIGTYSASKGFQGYMADFRAVKGTGVYSSNFTPPTSPLTAITNTSLLTLQYNGGANNQGIIDNSNFNNIITRNGNATQGSFSPYSVTGWSNYFSSASLNVPNSAALDLGSGAYTIEGWFNTNTTAGQQTIISFLTGFKLTVISTGLRVWGDAGSTYENATATIIPNTWYHFAWVRSSTSLGKLYLDGVLILTITSGVIVSSTPTGQNVLIGTYGDGFSNGFFGYISNLRVLKGTALYTSAFTPQTTPLTAIANTSLLTCQSNRFIDNSTINAALTINGGTPSVQAFSPFAPSVVYTPSLHGGSAYFDGTGDYLTVPANTELNLSGNFTIEFWVYPTASIASKSIAGTTSSSMHFDSGGNFYLLNSIGQYLRATDASFLTLNTWTHVAISRSGATLKFFRNGIDNGIGENVGSASTATFTFSGLNIGYSPHVNASSYLTGHISDFRVVKGTAVYTSNFVPPAQTLGNYSATYPSQLLLNFNNGGIIDQHSTNVLETVGNAQLSTAVKKYNNASMYFDGTGDYLTSPSSPNYQFGTGNYTIEAWIYPTNWSSSTNNNIVNIGTYITGLMIRGQSTSGIEIYTNNAQRLNLTTGITVNTWQHIALVRNGSACTFYVNGSSIGTFTDSSSIAPTSAILTIGMAAHNSSEFYTGYIDDLRITKGYARYTTTFTPPSTALITK